MGKDRIRDLRDEIDAIDDQILSLLNRRAKAVSEVGKIKSEQNLRFYVPEREVEILRRITGANPGPFPNDALKSIYREIISASLALEKPLSVAFLGPRATFTHLACLKHFGESADYVAQINVSEVFDAVVRGNADFGVVPIENSSEGIVSNTLDMFVDHNLLISGEILIEVAHDLLSVTGDIEHVKKVYSHPHAIAQCRTWLERNLKHVAVFDVESTARAAELAIDDPSAAAIAGEAAAKIYGLKCIRKRIQDNTNNVTRFIIIGRIAPERTGHDKTSVLFSARDEVGALYLMLEPFARHRINLTKIESRPVKKKAWEYLFFLDMEGHLTDDPVARALDELRMRASYLKILGSYPRAI
ncbi:MAG TPA: prephenate dehydratase [Candidatus Deferrimicrobiaceae bacterium]|nr:prephenate dehydratase [Candidatus Deferrimicrobiaceae bacterium]